MVGSSLSIIIFVKVIRRSEENNKKKLQPIHAQQSDIICQGASNSTISQYLPNVSCLRWAELPGSRLFRIILVVGGERF
jgi:hypothetical protein